MVYNIYSHFYDPESQLVVSGPFWNYISDQVYNCMNERLVPLCINRTQLKASWNPWTLLHYGTEGFKWYWITVGKIRRLFLFWRRVWVWIFFPTTVWEVRASWSRYGDQLKAPFKPPSTIFMPCSVVHAVRGIHNSVKKRGRWISYLGRKLALSDSFSDEKIGGGGVGGCCHCQPLPI